MSIAKPVRRTKIPSDITLSEKGTVLDLLKAYVDVCALEFCGKCMPCCYGTKEWQNLFQKLIDGHGTLEDLKKIQEINHTMKIASLCNMGLTSPFIIDKTLDKYHSEITDFISKGTPLTKEFTAFPEDILAN